MVGREQDNWLLKITKRVSRLDSGFYLDFVCLGDSVCWLPG